MSLSQQLIAKLFENPLEKFPPGETTKRDIYRVWMCRVENNGGRVTKTTHPKLVRTLAKDLIKHWESFEEASNLVNLDAVRSKVRGIVNHGDYLHHCGSRLDEIDFLRGEVEWFNVKVDLRKDETKLENSSKTRVSSA